MKKFAIQHKSLTLIIACQLVWLCYLIIYLLVPKHSYQFGTESMSILDANVSIGQSERVDSRIIDDNTRIIYDNRDKDREETAAFYINGNTEEADAMNEILSSVDFRLSPGVYEIKADYYSFLQNNLEGASCTDSTGSVIIESDRNENDLCYNELPLQDSLTENQTRLWVRSLTSIDQCRVKVIYNGRGELQIEKIVLQEIYSWRILRILGWLILFILLDGGYYCICSEHHIQNWRIATGLFLIVVITSIPLAADFLPYGHDLKFHLGRLYALAQEIKAGNWNCYLQTELMNGYGYAAPLFYGQLWMYPVAILYCLGAPLQLCYQIYVLAINCGTVLISYWVFYRWIKNENYALLGTFLYTTSAYRISNIYSRAAVGEFTAMMFFPLIIYGMYKIYADKTGRSKLTDWGIAVIGLTGIIQSHILSCEMVALFIVLFIVTHIRESVRFNRLLTFIKIAVMTLGINAFFLIPFLDSMRMDTKVRNMPIKYMQNEGAYLLQEIGLFYKSQGYSQIGMKDDIPVTLGLALVMGVLLFVYCMIKCKDWRMENDFRIIVGRVTMYYTLICMVISLRVFPWDTIIGMNKIFATIFGMVQFPYRYLALAAVFGTVTTIMGLSLIAEKVQKHTVGNICAVIVGIAILAIGAYYTDLGYYADEYKIYGGADITDSIRDEIGAGEYLLESTNEWDSQRKTVSGSTRYIEISDYHSDHGTIMMACTNSDNQMQELQIPIWAYDHYSVYDEENNVELQMKGGTNNCIAFWVPSGYQGHIRVQYNVRRIWSVANAVSCMMGIIFLVIIYIECRRSFKIGRN